MYTRYWRKQPRVTEQSDADDRLRRALENQFQSSFTKNIENAIADYVFITVYRNMCVVPIIGEEKFFQKRVSESLNERYFYTRRYLFLSGENSGPALSSDFFCSSLIY